jgi:hypothetical protein
MREFDEVEALTGLIPGQIAFLMDSLVSAQTHTRAGRVKPLADTLAYQGHCQWGRTWLQLHVILEELPCKQKQ